MSTSLPNLGSRPAADAREGDPAEISHITRGHVHRAVLRLALPTWGAFFAHNLMGITDMFFVGKLGPTAVAAVGLGSAMVGIIIMLAQTVSVGTTALVSQAWGREDRARGAAVAGQCVIMALVLSVLLAATGIPAAPTMVRLMGAEGDVIPLGAAYLAILSGGGFSILVAIGLGSALRGAGDARTPFWSILIGNVVNVVLDPILIFGWGPVPALGVHGSAWATVVGRGVVLIIMVRAFAMPGRGPIRLRLQHFRPDPVTMRRVAGIGLFSSGRLLLRNIAMLLFLRMAALFGTAALAAFGLCLRLQMVVFGPTIGFSVAASTVVGQNLGARQPDRARHAGWVAAVLGVAVVGSIATACWLGAEQIIPVFNRDPEVVALGSSCLRWLALSFAFMTLTIVLSFAMNGAGDTFRPMVVSGISMLGCGVPLAYVLAANMGRPEGIWIAIFCSHVVGGALSMAAFHHGRWLEVGQRTAQREEALETV